MMARSLAMSCVPGTSVHARFPPTHLGGQTHVCNWGCPARLCPACQRPTCTCFHVRAGDWCFCVLRYNDRLVAQWRHWMCTFCCCWRTVLWNLIYLVCRGEAKVTYLKAGIIVQQAVVEAIIKFLTWPWEPMVYKAMVGFAETRLSIRTWKN